MSIQLFFSWFFFFFFFFFWFSGYFFSADACVVCIDSGRCNQSSFAFLNVIFEFLYRSIDAILSNPLLSSLLDTNSLVLLLLSPLEFFSSALADGLSLEFE